MDFETRAIHEGQEPDPATGAVITPIYQTATYVQEEVGRHKGYDYSRVANPTRTALETALASLEGAEFELAPIPDAYASPNSAPSREASAVSSAVRVGLATRE